MQRSNRNVVIEGNGRVAPLKSTALPALFGPAIPERLCWFFGAGVVECVFFAGRDFCIVRGRPRNQQETKSMRRYESVFVLAPTLTDDEVDQVVDLFKRTAEDKGADIVNIDRWGRRRLAFPVDKHTEGIYVIFTLDEPAAVAVNELERRFKVTDSVIRFLTVRIDEDLKRAEKFKRDRDARKKKRNVAAEPPRREEVAETVAEGEEE
jgi:small subunit ribosomal protein S6